MPEPPRILIVDDDPMVARIMSLVLSGEGLQCSVTRAIGGEMALRLLRDSGPFDLVLTDASMPGMDGFELARAIRSGITEVGENGTTRDVLIAMITGGASVEDRDRALASGCNFMWFKPMHPGELIEVVTNALHGNPAG